MHSFWVRRDKPGAISPRINAQIASSLLNCTRNGGRCSRTGQILLKPAAGVAPLGVLLARGGATPAKWVHGTDDDD